MLGMQQAVADRIRDLRRIEIDTARGVRLLNVQYGASGKFKRSQRASNKLTASLPANALGLFAPVFTIVLYACLASLRGDVMDAETAFTTVALLLMITRT